MAELVIRQIPVLKDNYVYLIHEPQSRRDRRGRSRRRAAGAWRRLQATGWRITHILNTHHHNDHTGGNREIKAATGCIIVGPRADRDRIPGIDIEVGDGDTYEFGTRESARLRRARPYARPYRLSVRQFAARSFAATRCSSWAAAASSRARMRRCGTRSRKLKALPPETRVFCAHEYTQANARFALTVEPGNRDLVARAAMSTRCAPRANRPCRARWPRN